MVFHLTQMRTLTIFFPGQQVEHVADVGTLQRKGSNEPVLLMQTTNQDTLKVTPLPYGLHKLILLHSICCLN